MSTSGDENSARRYHHGHLREALIGAALEAARTQGPEAVVLRAATRAAGVSPNAAYRHFDDRDDLLRAVALHCQGQMADLMETRVAEAELGDGAKAEAAWERLRVVGRAYVEFAISEPGWFRSAFAIPLGVDTTARATSEDVPRLYALLTSTLDELVDTGAILPSARPGAEFVAWSSVHGIATLLTSGSLRDLPAHERDAVVERVINAVAF